MDFEYLKEVRLRYEVEPVDLTTPPSRKENPQPELSLKLILNEDADLVYQDGHLHYAIAETIAEELKAMLDLNPLLED